MPETSPTTDPAGPPQRGPFSTIEEAIEEIRRGRMVVVWTTRTARTRAT